VTSVAACGRPAVVLQARPRDAPTLMAPQPVAQLPGPSSDAADHVRDARQRARMVLGAESHLGEVDDWRRAMVTARDAVILLWLAWVALAGFGLTAHAGSLLTALALGIALLMGISTGRSTLAQVQYYESELERERREIRHHLDEEREEVRALYAAKGFQDPLLTQIVDTLSADDDRLLKVMMEEELGLSMHHLSHPLMVGLWNFGGAAAAGLLLALPLQGMSPEQATTWVVGGGAALLAALSVVTARLTGREMIGLFASSVVMATITGGVVYYLSQWLAAFGPIVAGQP